jgi:hypothetical protein
MNDLTWVEWIGYLGSALVALSLAMSSIVKLRWINLAGSVVFVIYGIIIDAIPVALVNGIIVVVNLYYLWKIYARTDLFRILEVDPGDHYLEAFIDYYRTLIARDFPAFMSLKEKGRLACLILRNMQIAGVFVGTQKEGELRIDLDFVIPKFRDYKAGKYLLIDNQSFFLKKGISRLRILEFHSGYAKYFSRMGFIKTGRDGKKEFVKELKSQADHGLLRKS